MTSTLTRDEDLHHEELLGARIMQQIMIAPCRQALRETHLRLLVDQIPVVTDNDSLARDLDLVLLEVMTAEEDVSLRVHRLNERLCTTITHITAIFTLELNGLDLFEFRLLLDGMRFDTVSHISIFR